VPAVQEGVPHARRPEATVTGHPRVATTTTATTTDVAAETTISMMTGDAITVDGPYNKDLTVKTSGSSGVYNKFHPHFLY
jgi:hypothetical protein